MCVLCIYAVGALGREIPSLTFDSARGGRRFTYEHTDSVYGFQVCKHT